MTPEELREIDCYGKTKKEVENEPILPMDKKKYRMMYAASILSDVQEVLEYDPDLARKWINKAKYWLFQELRS